MRPDVRAVILVHLGGFITPEWERLRLLAKNNGAWLLEDAAHAHGAAINCRPAGSLGGAAAFSLYATKVLTTSEGGMAVTSDGGLLRRMEAIRQHGQKRPGSNTHELFGLNFRPSEIHALLGLNILPRAGEILAGRRKAAKVWDSLLKGSKLEPLLPPPGSEPSYYKYFALLPEGLDRAAFKARLFERHGLRLPSEAYSTPLHLQPFWRENPEFLAAEPSGLGNSLMIARRHICLPVWPGLPEDDQKRAAEALLENLEALG